VVRGQVASDNGWLVILSRPGRFGGDEPGFEAMGGWNPQTAHSQHLAIFYQFQNFQCPRALTYIFTVSKQVRKTNLTFFLYQFEKRGGKSVLTFRTQDLVDFVFERKKERKFSKGSRPPLRHMYSFKATSIPSSKSLMYQKEKNWDKLFADHVTQVCEAHNRVIVSFLQ